MARRALLAVVLSSALILLAACGADSTTAPDNTPAPTPAYIRWTLDGQTCTGGDAINFYVDGALVGTESIVAGGSSKLYATLPGSHQLGATEARTGGFVWPSVPVFISAGVTDTQILTCS